LAQPRTATGEETWRGLYRLEYFELPRPERADNHRNVSVDQPL
jgi:hypothetical protein